MSVKRNQTTDFTADIKQNYARIFYYCSHTCRGQLKTHDIVLVNTVNNNFFTLARRTHTTVTDIARKYTITTNAVKNERYTQHCTAQPAATLHNINRKTVGGLKI